MFEKFANKTLRDNSYPYVFFHYIEKRGNIFFFFIKFFMCCISFWTRKSLLKLKVCTVCLKTSATVLFSCKHAKLVTMHSHQQLFRVLVKKKTNFKKHSQRGIYWFSLINCHKLVFNNNILFLISFLKFSGLNNKNSYSFSSNQQLKKKHVLAKAAKSKSMFAKNKIKKHAF